jgi:hypothetical protein
MRRVFSALFLGQILFFSLAFTPVSAQSSGAIDPEFSSQPKSLLPEDDVLPPGITVDCMRFMKNLQGSLDFRRKVKMNEKGSPGQLFLDSKGTPSSETYSLSFRDTALSCGIKTGRIELWLVPFYLVRVIDFALLLAGLASVFFIILGSYHMIIGSYTEDKEKGKKTIMYALLGLTLSLLSYTIVNLLLLFLTA